jgi:hypothetical protein
MIVDVNVSLGSWPFRDFSVDSAEKLNRCLKKLHIGQAWVRSSRAAFLTDTEVDNEKLRCKLKSYPDLIAVPTVNPVLSQWKKSARDSVIINIYPSYHRYRVDSREICQLAEKLVKKKGILLITMRMEDSRGMHPDCFIPDVPVEGIKFIADKYPELKIICLNATVFEMEKLLDEKPNIYCDTAYAESGDTIKNIIDKVDYSKIIFGSHTPFFYTGAELMKIEYSAVSSQVKKRILHCNTPISNDSE